MAAVKSYWDSPVLRSCTYRLISIPEIAPADPAKLVLTAAKAATDPCELAFGNVKADPGLKPYPGIGSRK
jgi:hypothetical protein